jgi:hypothetical protein
LRFGSGLGFSEDEMHGCHGRNGHGQAYTVAHNLALSAGERIRAAEDAVAVGVQDGIDDCGGSVPANQ